MKIIKFRGRNRIDVKKRVLDYYYTSACQANGTIKEFFRRCTIDPSGKTVVYRGK